MEESLLISVMEQHALLMVCVQLTHVSMDYALLAITLLILMLNVMALLALMIQTARLVLVSLVFANHVTLLLNVME
jgi:hypothetical protein